MADQTPFSKVPRKQTLADQVAAAVKASILAGELDEGDALPTEPQLCEQFGVSRAVVRDATRILLAQGLVDVKQGSGVYVTPARNDSFGEALLLSLRRMDATAWDVEQFERLLLPEVAALAATAATDDDIAHLQQSLVEYLAIHASYASAWHGVPYDEIPDSETASIEEQYQRLSRAVFEATHNQVLTLFADPLIRLHAMRRWEGTGITTESIIAAEGKILGAIVDAISNRNPEQAREAVVSIQHLPDAAVTAMRSTPIGETIDIRV